MIRKTFTTIGVAMEVHRELGHGFLAAVCPVHSNLRESEPALSLSNGSICG